MLCYWFDLYAERQSEKLLKLLRFFKASLINVLVCLGEGNNPMSSD